MRLETEAFRQTPAPRAVFAIRDVTGTRDEVRVAREQRVATRLRQACRDEHVLVGKRDRGAARQLSGHRLERGGCLFALARDTEAPQDGGRSPDAFERAEHDALQ